MVVKLRVCALWQAFKELASGIAERGWRALAVLWSTAAEMLRRAWTRARFRSISVRLYILSRWERAWNFSAGTKRVLALWLGCLAFVYATLSFTAYSTWSPVVTAVELVNVLPCVEVSSTDVLAWVTRILAVTFYVFLFLFVALTGIALWSMAGDIFGVGKPTRESWTKRTAKRLDCEAKRLRREIDDERSKRDSKRS